MVDLTEIPGLFRLSMTIPIRALFQAVMMRGDPVVVTIDNIADTTLGNPNFIEHQPYTVTFSAERCEWSVVGPMVYPQQFGLVEHHRRIYGPLIEKPSMTAEEVRSGGECVQPTGSQLYFVGLRFGFDANGTLTAQVPNPAQYGSFTIPKRIGHLSLPQ